MVTIPSSVHNLFVCSSINACNVASAVNDTKKGRRKRTDQNWTLCASSHPLVFVRPLMKGMWRRIQLTRNEGLIEKNEREGTSFSPGALLSWNLECLSKTGTLFVWIPIRQFENGWSSPSD